MGKDSSKIKKKKVLHSCSDDEENSRLKKSRRSLLAGLAGTSIGGYLAGIIGIDTSEAKQVSNAKLERLSLVKGRYQSKSDIKSVINRHGALLAGLANQGLISNSSVESIPLKAVQPTSEFVDAKSGATVTALPTNDGSVTAHIQIKWKAAGRDVTLIARPEEGRMYAIADCCLRFWPSNDRN